MAEHRTLQVPGEPKQAPPSWVWKMEWGSPKGLFSLQGLLSRLRLLETTDCPSPCSAGMFCHYGPFVSSIVCHFLTLLTPATLCKPFLPLVVYCSYFLPLSLSLWTQAVLSGEGHSPWSLNHMRWWVPQSLGVPSSLLLCTVSLPPEMCSFYYFWVWQCLSAKRQCLNN
jgi:hypothetical protein